MRGGNTQKSESSKDKKCLFKSVHKFLYFGKNNFEKNFIKSYPTLSQSYPHFLLAKRKESVLK